MAEDVLACARKKSHEHQKENKTPFHIEEKIDLRR